LLIILGFGGYFGTGRTSATALIPCAFGVLLLAAGIVATKYPKGKMHAMHIAILFALFGLVAAAVRAIPALLDHNYRPAVIMQLLMALICLVFVGLSVRSFIDARRTPQTRSGRRAGNNSIGKAKILFAQIRTLVN